MGKEHVLKSGFKTWEDANAVADQHEDSDREEKRKHSRSTRNNIPPQVNAFHIPKFELPPGKLLSTASTPVSFVKIFVKHLH